MLPPRSTPPAPTVYFSPGGGCEAAVVAAIAAARKSIRVLAYTFTSKPILAALNDATARRLDVVAILDGGQVGNPASLGTALACPVYYDHRHLIAHNKTMVLDGIAVITGSFNFTVAAEHANAENLLIVRSRALAAAYLADWEHHLAHSAGPAVTLPRPAGR